MLARIAPTLFILVVAGSALSAQPAATQPASPSIPLTLQPSPEGFKTPDNAALLYYQALLKIDRDKVGTLRPEQAAADWAPDAAGREVLRDHQSAVGVLVRASQINACDWGYEYGLGWSMELPHLGALRGAARLLDADARRLIADQEPGAEVGARLAAMLRLANHASSEPVLIGSLVGTAICTLAADTIEFALSRGALDAAGRDMVLRAAKALRTGDPLHYKDALRNEQRVSAASLRAIIDGHDTVLARGLQSILSEADKDGAARALTGASLAVALKQLSACYDEMLSAWDAPRDEALSRFSALNSGVDNGQHGLFAKLLLPAITKAYESQQKVRARLDALISSLEHYTPPAPAGK